MAEEAETTKKRMAARQGCGKSFEERAVKAEMESKDLKSMVKKMTTERNKGPVMHDVADEGGDEERQTRRTANQGRLRLRSRVVPLNTATPLCSHPRVCHEILLWTKRGAAIAVT